MAFDPTQLLEARATIESAMAGRINQNNLRIPYFGAADALINGAPQLISGVSDLKQSTSQPVKIPVFNKVPAGTGTLRKCAGTGTGSVALVPIVYEGITEEFNLNDLDHQGNAVTRDMAFAYLVAQKAKNIYQRIDDKAKAFLESQKATVNKGTYFGTTLAGAKRVPYAQRNELFAGIQAELRSNNFSGVAEAVTGFNMGALYGFQQNQGPANAQNLQYQLQNFNPYFTAMNNGAGVFDTAYAFEAGTVGMFDWLRPDFRRGRDIGTDVWMTYRLPAMPGMAQGLEVELKVKYGCQGEAEYTESYVMHIDVAFLGAYAEETGDTGVYKYELLQGA
ncbi:hypothetical protein DNI29_04440 [Hymenobacter sediminis]|uniref:hypothetical protein n=1 Tax=Hymenobacter sediminis TaxID=2218621 RepID=UPI000DA6D810|nr:hypothetical protein [Hymenobacter sediminis]RPD50051.1 hypothetical protein DNI29_04440 [Hymenobacter sediminis]